MRQKKSTSQDGRYGKNSLNIVDSGASLNAVARVKSVIMLQHDHRSRSLCNRIYYGARTHVPLDAQRLLGFASDLDGRQRASRGYAPIKTAMEKEQVRERERYTRKTRFSPPFT